MSLCHLRRRRWENRSRREGVDLSKRLVVRDGNSLELANNLRCLASQRKNGLDVAGSREAEAAAVIRRNTDRAHSRVRAEDRGRSRFNEIETGFVAGARFEGVLLLDGRGRLVGRIHERSIAQGQQRPGARDAPGLRRRLSLPSVAVGVAGARPVLAFPLCLG